jgi:hypothetical protein
MEEQEIIELVIEKKRTAAEVLKKSFKGMESKRRKLRNTEKSAQISGAKL